MNELSVCLLKDKYLQFYCAYLKDDGLLFATFVCKISIWVSRLTCAVQSKLKLGNR